MRKLVLSFLLLVIASSQYNPSLSKQLCILSLVSYCRPTQVIGWSCIPCKNSTLGIQNVTLFVNSTADTLGFISVSKPLDALVLVFRGTVPWDIKNWISDIDFVATPFDLCNKNCKVHEGFQKAYMEIHDQIMTQVESYKKLYKFSKIIVAGHSLGGALATLAVAHLIKAGHKVDLLETYGSPRVGDSAFSKWYQTIYPNLKPRITHAHDPVPHLPLEAMGFRHIQTEVFYSGKVSKGYKICNDSNGEDKACSNQYWTDVDVLDHLSYYDIDFTTTTLKCQ